jgi:putative transposase
MSKGQWFLHAHVIMGNHYHLVLETPEGNLVEGMRWLQSTFGIRFNALREERGHVFQSRFKVW